MQREKHQIVRFKKEFETRTEELHDIRQRVEDEAIDFGFDQETAFRLALAVDEACTNIIKHSYAGNPANTFEVEISTAGDRFVIALTDHGKSFDPSDLPVLDMKKYFEQCLRGGLGVHIIKMVMDDVAYAVMKNHANQLRMIKRLL
ncbi:MAG: putative anti-sigma regulatory factor, serine/threonine protein kinase [Chlorobi bacterium]|jgi:serine/threonine-protein kinase RsbW|nr:putative anti-sigma regulatory factor, serine/threonine protein kinase [Chlorobiota bacterium]